MSHATEKRIGLVLAAGRGRRMGRTKQLVRWRMVDGEKPLVAAAYDAIRVVCDEMIVVLGHQADAVADALGDRPFLRVDSDPDAPMFASIRAGLTAAQATDASASVLLQPGDCPEASPATLAALIAEGTRHPRHAILPEYSGQGGHPVLMSANIVDRLLQDDCPAGLARYWNDHPELVRRLSVNDPAVILDIDTPDQVGQDELLG